MIKGSFCNISEDTKMFEKVKNALNYLKTTDIQALPLGRNEINDDMYAQVLEYETQDLNDVFFETHKNYLDLHFIVSGEEIIQLCDSKSLTKTEYNEIRDLQFYEDTNQFNEIMLATNDYLFIQEYEAHRTNGYVDQTSGPVKKIVIKIKIK